MLKIDYLYYARFQCKDRAVTRFVVGEKHEHGYQECQIDYYSALDIRHFFTMHSVDMVKRNIHLLDYPKNEPSIQWIEQHIQSLGFQYIGDNTALIDLHEADSHVSAPSD